MRHLLPCVIEQVPDHPFQVDDNPPAVSAGLLRRASGCASAAYDPDSKARASVLSAAEGPDDIKPGA